MGSRKTCLLLLGMALLAAGCGGAKAAVEAGTRADAEQPSIEVCLDRLEDVSTVHAQLDSFLYRAPVSVGAPWVEKLRAVPQERALAIAEQARGVRPYSAGGRVVPPIKVLRVYNEEVILEGTEFTGEHLNLLAALDALGVPEGSRIKNKYEAVRTTRQEMAQIEGTLSGLEAEAERDRTPQRRQRMIAAEMDKLTVELQDLETRGEGAEEALFSLVADLEAHGPLGPEMQPLAATLFTAFQHLARVEEEVQITSYLVKIQAVQAVPDLPAELQAMATGLVGDAVVELGGQADAARNARVTVEMTGGEPRVEVQGITGIDPLTVARNLKGKLSMIATQALDAPAQATTGASLAAFEARFLGALAQALATNSGNTFSPALTFQLPAVAAPAPAPPQPQPAPAPAPAPTPMPPQPAPTQPQPAPPPPAQPQPAPAPAMPPAQPAPAQPQPAPAAVPPPPPAASPTPPPPAAPACPPQLCQGPITAEGIGQIRLGMPGAQAANVLQVSITPATDADHKQPYDDVGGVLISFCNDSVCRLEATRPEPKANGKWGVGSQLKQVARKLGDSKCVPIDAKRFAVEFEKLPGVYWISDKLDCEGIEDLDYWKRPSPGKVTHVIVGLPK